MRGIGFASYFVSGSISSPVAFLNPKMVAGSGAPFAIFLPTGSKVSDILVLQIVVVNPGSAPTLGVTIGLGGNAMTQLDTRTWTNSTTDYSFLYYRVLNAADITAGTFNISSTAGSQHIFNAASYRGTSTTVTSRVFTGNATSLSSIAFGGVTPVAGTQGFAALIVQKDTGAATLTSSGWTASANATSTTSRGFEMDKFTGYTNASVTFSGLSGGSPSSGYLFEFSGGPNTSKLLMETSGAILLESGSYLVQEY